MKTFITIFAILSSGYISSHAVADSIVSKENNAKQSMSSMKFPMYQPPKRGAPSIRVGGGTRGTANAMPVLNVLAPDHVGLTANKQPTLNWHISTPSSMRLEILVVNEDEMDPVFELVLDSKKLKKGLQSLNLADYGVKLKPGLPYQWSVSLVAEKGRPSGDIMSSGMIQVKTLPKSIKAKLKKASSYDDVFIYANEGYWYDAISQISALIDKDPSSNTLKQQRAQLLKQIGLLDLE